MGLNNYILVIIYWYTGKIPNKEMIAHFSLNFLPVFGIKSGKL